MARGGQGLTTAASLPPQNGAAVRSAEGSQTSITGSLNETVRTATTMFYLKTTTMVYVEDWPDFIWLMSHILLTFALCRFPEPGYTNPNVGDKVEIKTVAVKREPEKIEEQTVIESIFHINVNCTNFDRSLEFYKTLGFKVIRDLNEVGSEKLSQGLRIPNGRGRAVLMILGDNPRSTRLDLIEWKNPKTEGQPHPHLWHAGMCRIALRTRTLVKDCEELRSKGIEFWSEPIMFEVKGGRQEGFVCCTDPDGTVIELIQV